MVEIDLPRPRTSEIVSSTAFGRYVAEIWHDLREEASRGMQDAEQRSLQAGSHDFRPSRLADYAPAALGLGTLILGVVALEILIRVGIVNRYVVPLPSQIIASFGRVVFEEDILDRFLLTAGEALAAGVLLTVVGIALGALLHRVTLLRMATETWVAALAAAPIVLMYPLFLVIFAVTPPPS